MSKSKELAFFKGALRCLASIELKIYNILRTEGVYITDQQTSTDRVLRWRDWGESSP